MPSGAPPASATADHESGSLLEKAPGMREMGEETGLNWPASAEAALDNFWAHVEKLTPQVLVVDDESLIRWSVAETLAERGMRVFQASDGASAVRVLATQIQPFDVVVLDLRLPDVNDLSLLVKVRELSPASRVIVMTAFGTAEVTGRALELGAFRVIHKPFEMEDLAAITEAAVISLRGLDA